MVIARPVVRTEALKFSGPSWAPQKKDDLFTWGYMAWPFVDVIHNVVSLILQT